MAFNTNTPSNRPSEAPSEQQRSESMDSLRSADTLVQSANVASSAAEALGGADAGLEIGNIAENVREGSEVKGDSAGTKGDDDDDATARSGGVDPAAIRAQLLKNIPPEPVMKKQIETEIRKEIKYLRKKALKMVRSPKNMDFFEMANILKKIRELKGLLATLLKSSLEHLKTLWLRFVHGIM